MAKKTESIKMNIYGYTTIVIIILAIIGSVFLLIPSEKKTIADSFEGTELTLEHVYDQVSFKEFLKAIKEDKNVYVYFGSPETDVVNTEQKPGETKTYLKIEVFNANAKLLDIDKILYLNSSKLSDSQLEVIRGYINDLELNITNIDYIASPDLWVFKNGTLRNTYSKYAPLMLNDAYVSRLIFQYNIE